jgi:hypothetical protein
MISAQTRSAFVARENRFTLFRIMRWAAGATLKQNGRPFWAAVSPIGINRD